jgi:uncharacterized protein (TIGR02246 family)
MTPEQARQIHTAFTAAFNSGNLDALVAMYEPTAVVIPGPGAEPVAGHAAIRACLTQFLATKGKMEIRDVYCYTTADLAMARGKWTITGTNPDGSPLLIAGDFIETHRRQPDGKWLIALDHPFGAV